MSQHQVVAKEDRYDPKTGKKVLWKGLRYSADQIGGVTVGGVRYGSQLFEPYVEPYLYKAGDMVEYINRDSYQVGRQFVVKRDQKPREDYLVVDPPLSHSSRSAKVADFRKVEAKLQATEWTPQVAVPSGSRFEWLPETDAEWAKFIAAGGKLHFRSGCEVKFVAFVKDAKPHCQLVLLNPATGNVVTRYANGKSSTETVPEPGDILIGASKQCSM